MKINIDLNEILNDEYGPTENLAQSIQRQVVDQVKDEVSKGISKQIDEQISKYIGETIKIEIDKRMPEFVEQLLDAEYQPIDRYGSRDKNTTFRKEMIKAIHENMEYKPEKDSYYRDRENAFTRAVKSFLDVETKKFQENFNSIVTTEFTKTTLKIVTDELSKKFGISK